VYTLGVHRLVELRGWRVGEEVGMGGDGKGWEGKG
jgi:hypothetical protein